MSVTLFLLLVASFFAPSHTQLPLHTTEQSYISLLISQKGLDFVKDLLISKVVSSLVPLKLPQILKYVKIPFVGSVHVVLSNITIFHVDVSESYIKPGDTGVSIIASRIACNLSMNWSYSYRTWLLPVKISDHGDASVQVEGMEVGITLGLENQEGSLRLSLNECGCYIEDIFIKLDGGASWLYQGVVDAFEGQIGSVVENAITEKVEEGIVKLDSFLQMLPKEILVDDIASLNVKITNGPLLSNSSIGFEINGLFIANKKFAVSHINHKNMYTSVYCKDSSQMFGISLDEAVFNSASSLYFNADFMHWIVDKLPDQSLLNTAGWRFIVPQLYKKYPNDDMNINISLSSPPFIRISRNCIDVTIYADLVIDVLENGEVIPVACISLVIQSSGSVKILRNNLAGSVKLDDFSMSLKWSKIGDLHLYLVQPLMWTILETLVFPRTNSYLAKGFPMPMVQGFTLQNAEILCLNSRINVCSNVAFVGSYDLNQLLID